MRSSPSDGLIEFITGTMFGGKTKELIRRLHEAETHGKAVKAFKPSCDDRYHVSRITSHDGDYYDAVIVSSSKDILSAEIENIDVLGIDEGQFFDSDLPTVVTELADRGVRVIVAALVLDYLRKPFGYAPAVLAMADLTTKVRAKCASCLRNGSFRYADFSHRTANIGGVTVVGGAEAYEPLCRSCYVSALGASR